MDVQVALDNFSARLDTRPGAGETLTVKGSIQAPSRGWRATLTEKVQPGADPTTLFLSLSCFAPHGDVSPALTLEPVVFAKTDASRYLRVTLTYEGDTMTLQVAR